MQNNNVLICNAVPTNNGDAALVFSLYEAFKNKGYNTKIAAMHYSLVKQNYNDFPIVQELGDAAIWKKFRYYSIIKRNSPFLFYWFSSHFRNCDFLVSSSVGYINSYYGFKKVALTFKIAKLLGKKTAIYSQSIGPLDKKGKKRMKQLARDVDLIFVRDDFSLNILKNLELKTKNYRLTEDAAFLFKYNQSKGSASSNTVAISVRDWKHDNRDVLQFYKMIIEFVKIIIKQGYKIEFISTCQGLDGYVDDSKVAKVIVNMLEEKYKESITINSNYYNLEEFRDYIRNFHIVIGTRLHMCILSMLAGIPAFNISYEVKGEEVYKYCGLKEYSVDYNENIENAISSFKHFLNNKESFRSSLPIIMQERNKRAQESFEF